jgi:hypothetical protein
MVAENWDSTGYRALGSGQDFWDLGFVQSIENRDILFWGQVDDVVDTVVQSSYNWVG